MNAITSFRLCTLSDEELLKKVDEMTDDIYTNGRLPARHIPARPNDDYDLLVGELLIRFQSMLKKSDGRQNHSPVKDDWKEAFDNALKEKILSMFITSNQKKYVKRGAEWAHDWIESNIIKVNL